MYNFTIQKLKSMLRRMLTNFINPRIKIKNLNFLPFNNVASSDWTISKRFPALSKFFPSR